MAKKFSELRARMSPKARAQSEAMTARLLKGVRGGTHAARPA